MVRGFPLVPILSSFTNYDTSWFFSETSMIINDLSRYHGQFSQAYKYDKLEKNLTFNPHFARLK
jgi:hypothetical protein